MGKTTYLILRSVFKNLGKEELIFGDNGIVRMSNLSSFAEKQKHWLHETLILMVFEVRSLAATEVPFSSVKTCSTSAAFCWELKLNGAWWDCEILRVRAHRKFDGSTGLLDLDFIFMFRVIDLRSGDQDGDSMVLYSRATLRPSVSAGWHLHNKCSFIYKANWKRWVYF